ncbi:MAG: cytochrome P450 [Pseudobdellovibrio sp.]
MSTTQNLPPGNLSLWKSHLKNSFDFFADPVLFTEKMRKSYGNIFASRIFGMHFLFVTSSQHKEWVLTGEGQYLKNDWQPTLNKLFWPSTLPLLTGTEHKERRQVVSQILAQQFQKNIPQFQKKVEAFCLSLDKKENVALETEFKQLTVQISTLALLEQELPLLDLLENWVAGFFAFVPVNFPGSAFQKATTSKQKLKERIIGSLQKSKINYSEYFSDNTSLEEIAEEIQHLLFASYNTTAVSLTNAMVLLSGRPDLRRALKTAVDTKWDELIKNPLASMELNNFVYYSLTKVPSVIGIFRETTKTVRFNEYTVPKGWKIVLQPAQETLLAEEKQISENKEDLDKILNWIKLAPRDSFYPFGGGGRLCLGRNFALSEMALVLSHLLHFTDWEATASQDLTYKKMPFPIPRSGLVVNFK